MGVSCYLIDTKQGTREDRKMTPKRFQRLGTGKFWASRERGRILVSQTAQAGPPPKLQTISLLWHIFVNDKWDWSPRKKPKALPNQPAQWRFCSSASRSCLSSAE